MTPHPLLEAAEQGLCGVDEVGRGPLAGPVVAAAVVFRGVPPDGLKDSKKLSAARRQRLEPLIQAQAVWAIGSASVEEIDALNILQATFLAMQRAVQGVAAQCVVREVVVDGNRAPTFVGVDRVRAEIKADDHVLEVSAASILAKVYRDRLMEQMDVQYPGYGFARHSGYGVAQHLKALRELGPSPIHRRSFAPVRDVLELGAFTPPKASPAE